MQQLSLTVLLPVFNDWQSARALINEIRANFSDFDHTVELEIVVVDDGSTIPPPAEFDDLADGTNELILLKSDVNLGHQRAILRGVDYFLDSSHSNFLCVMDADGEDVPAAVPTLVRASISCPDVVIVAKRGRRSESVSFKISYWIHRAIFRLATGKSLDFGNFLLLPKSRAHELRNLRFPAAHIASQLLKSDMPLLRVKVDRGKRYFGQSKMSLEKLVAHSFSALSNFRDSIFVRLTAAAAALSAVTIPAAFGILFLRVAGAPITPGWATSAIAFLIVLTVQFWSFVGLASLIHIYRDVPVSGGSPRIKTD